MIGFDGRCTQLEKIPQPRPGETQQTLTAAKDRFSRQRGPRSRGDSSARNSPSLGPGRRRALFSPLERSARSIALSPAKLSRTDVPSSLHPKIQDPQERIAFSFWLPIGEIYSDPMRESRRKCYVVVTKDPLGESL